ncbi:MAG TPA: general secretion pathway protein GspB, partial [Methylibium sp.]
ASAAEERIYAPADLPDEVRRSLPQLAIGGSVYSEAPGSRLLIVNGQPLHEGDQPAPGVVLERIKLKSAVMSYKGYRYEISY